MLKLRTFAFVLALVALGSGSAAANGFDQLSDINWLTPDNRCLNSPFDAAYHLLTTDTIKICKQTVPPGGTGFQFAWTNDLGPQAPFTLNDGQCEIKNIGAQVHFNAFTESVPAFWTLSNITCTQYDEPGKHCRSECQSGISTRRQQSHYRSE